MLILGAASLPSYIDGAPAMKCSSKKVSCVCVCGDYASFCSLVLVTELCYEAAHNFKLLTHK